MDSSLRSVAEQLLKDLQRTYSETNQNCDLCLALVLFRRWTWWTNALSHVCHLPAVERLFRTPPTITYLSPAFSTSPSVLLVSRECLCVWSAPHLPAIHDPWENKTSTSSTITPAMNYTCHHLPALCLPSLVVQ
ncbi:zinc finger SWIM domain-containing protein 7 isoform X5 [Megalobrama amblycephala]|nr:zinc finger SWIM domain-containing protein 7 isoform X5 [Megalobrama amblycephala]